MIKAAIDIGTVTSRLLVGESIEGSVDTQAYRTIITNLGEGLTSSKRISGAAYERLLQALLDFKETIAEVESTLITRGEKQTEIPIRAVATSAMRDAVNAPEILTKLAAEGFDIEIICGEKEAELSFKGTLSGFDNLEETLMSIDVGGGSTEIILGTNKADILLSHSFDMGSRRITEMFLIDDPPSDKQIQNAHSWVDDQTREFLTSLTVKPLEVIAVAGTATTAITIRDEIAIYDSALVHKTRMDTNGLKEIYSRLSLLKLEERKRVIGLEPGRAPVIIGGLIILETLLKILKAGSFVASDTDILQGILLYT